jgi:hypothetical protein
MVKVLESGATRRPRGRLVRVLGGVGGAGTDPTWGFDESSTAGPSSPSDVGPLTGFAPCDGPVVTICVVDAGSAPGATDTIRQMGAIAQEGGAAMSKRGRKRKSRKGSSANHGKRPNA